MQQEVAILRAEDVLTEIWREFETMFGRRYCSLDTYRTDDAEIILVTMGAIGETARIAVDEMRLDGIDVGVVRIRLWRPLPQQELVQVLKHAKIVSVLDRMLTPGGSGGPIGEALRSIFYDIEPRPKIMDFVVGLGGREIRRRTFKEIVSRSIHGTKQNRKYSFLDVRCA